MALERDAQDFLGSLERAELELLTWGLVDAFFTQDEIEHRADEFLSSRQGTAGHAYASGWDLVQELLDAHLLWELPEGNRFRSRMGEAVRLFLKLRQIFPDPQNAAWRDAPGLVSDYRLLVRPRSYPRRDIAPVDVLQAIRAQTRLLPIHEAVIRAIVRAGSVEERSLAGFQVRAASRVLSTIDSPRALGTIVCAGTGSGKTLAFYLPAYAAMAAQLTDDYWMKCLALYPRNELLQDQLREALSTARRVSAALAGHRRRKFVLAALYGDVPQNAAAVLRGNLDSWRATSIRGETAYLCPFVRCPQCNEPMGWLERDVQQNAERLACSRTSCNERIESDEIRLTRDRMFREPPDVLFTSTEMLNQRMSSSTFGPLFGIGLAAERRPRFVLIDEVHAYEGVHGAHVALLLRRWRRLADARPHFVGLSATLTDAPRFFGDLTGLGAGDVNEISPQSTEMEAEGAEYMLALRGDPSSGTSLLSTTIQTAMLLRRILGSQPRDDYGRRVFAFTDNLDVTNRLYHTLLDAEGWDSAGRPNAQRLAGSLANIRANALPSGRARLEQGQNWALVEAIGHSLSNASRVRVGRTSSQDAGVDPTAEIVVATSALEVGFDDPEVGAVLQHKAPLSDAGFLQRKGRAGRRREMRPWTVVVLSDYGRDRSAFQSYDLLFSPQLPPRHLPLQNRAVLRMQATYALVDWIARRTPSVSSSNPWSDLSQPTDEIQNPRWAEQTRQRQSRYSAQLALLLEREAVRTEFTTFLSRSLMIDEETAAALLWEAPRPVLTEAATTLLRRLERGWRRATDGTFEYFTPRAPLPEFMPRALFADLQLPEVSVRLPAFRQIGQRIEGMPLVQALREFAPGRVSRRFGVGHSLERHWIDPGSANDVVIDSFCPESDRQELGTFAYREAGSVVELRVFRPYAIGVTLPPPDVQQSSNAFLQWRTEIVPSGDGYFVDLPDGTSWSTTIQSIAFHTHHLGQPLECRRFTTGATASIGRGKNRPVERTLQFVTPPTADGIHHPCALGFIADVDGVRIRFRYPDDLVERCSSDERLLGVLRSARFRDLLRTSPRLDGFANRFQRDWISQAYLSTITAQALRAETTLAAAEEAVYRGTSTIRIADVLAAIFQWAPGDHDDGDGDVVIPRRLDELLDIVNQPSTTLALHESARVLWAQPSADWQPWLRDRFRSTLGASIIEAATTLCPRVDTDALVLDLDARSDVADFGPHDDELWLSETTIGGGGFLEEFLTRYVEDPRRFFRILETALGPSDREFVGMELEHVVASATSGLEQHQSLVAAFDGVRQAQSHEGNVTALNSLRNELSRIGVTPTPSVLVALNARVLRPGSTRDTDVLLADLIREWNAAESRLGIEVDARVFAYTKSADAPVEDALGVSLAGETIPAQVAWRYRVLCALLWPRGSQVRSESLRIASPFRQFADCDRLLVLAALSRRPGRIRVTANDWFDALSQLLVRNGNAELICEAEDPEPLAAALLRIGSTPVDSEGLLVHARLVGVQRDGVELRALIELPEAFQ